MGCIQFLTISLLPWVAVAVGPKHPIGWAAEGMLVAQLCLLGMWLGMSSSSWGTRAAGSLLGWFTSTAVFAFMVLSTSTGFGFATLFGGICIITVPLIALSAGISWAMRKWLANLILVGPDDSSTVTHGFQFTIGQVFIFITIIAILLAASRVSRAVFADRDPALSVIRSIAFLALMLVAYSSCTLGTLWAAFGASSSYARTTIVIVLAFLIGVTGNYAAGGSASEQFWRMPTSMLAAATFAVGSLLLVRSFGYRLVAHTSP